MIMVKWFKLRYFVEVTSTLGWWLGSFCCTIFIFFCKYKEKKVDITYSKNQTNKQTKKEWTEMGKTTGKTMLLLYFQPL